MVNQTCEHEPIIKQLKVRIQTLEKSCEIQKQKTTSVENELKTLLQMMDVKAKECKKLKE